MAVPVRTCVGCRRRAPKAELVRIVCRPDGSLTVDRDGRTPGRGAYVCSGGDCLDQAAKRSRLGRALRAPVGAGELERLRMEFSG
ncbi:MAG TPA: YlxR family protein [Actinomycetota bacterium]|nr:YlxR family protein [Actinomycetota bacterium]